MAAMLNGATVLDWAARLVGEPDIATLLARVEAKFTGPSPVVFLPYLSGEPTPHNDAGARGVFFGLDAAIAREELIQAALEGVVFSFMDAKLALGTAGHGVGQVAAIGGGAQSRFWMKLIASGLGIPVLRSAGAGKGPAVGAARLARLALTGETPESVCAKPTSMETIEPDTTLGEAYQERFALYRRLYANLKRVRRPLTDRR
jgi:xylulokinase